MSETETGASVATKITKLAKPLGVQSPVDLAERKKLDIRSGDTIRVWQKIQEKEAKSGKLKTRLQAFEGLVIAVKHGKEAGGTFTVRRVASGVGVEKIFPIYSPMIDSVETIKRAKVRRAKLYHIRDKAAKEIRRQMRNIRAEKEPKEVVETTETETAVAE
jgi:large subunit ribosomal protein L19